MAASVGNRNFGILIYGNENTIGLSNIQNTICRNRIGVQIQGVNNTVQACYLGTNFSQAQGLGNLEQNLTLAAGASNNLIGGANPSLGNWIMGSGGDGVLITDTETHDNKLQ